METPHAHVLMEALRSVRFHFTEEPLLQDGIEALLTEKGIPFSREHHLSARDRIDFLSKDVGIEVKVASSASVVQRQLERYAESPEVGTLILVTTRSSHRTLPMQVRGKDLYIHHLITSAL